MELEQVLRRRRMVRSYDATRPVPPAAVEAVLAAAVRAPSAGFTQGVSFLVLTEPEQRDLYWQTTAPPGTEQRETGWLRGLRTAPVLILVWASRGAYVERYAEPDKGWTDRDPTRWPAPFWFVDGGMAAMAALLQAVDAELGACFFGIPADRVEAVRAAYGVPVEQLGVGVVSLGYPDSLARRTGSVTRRARRPVGELIHRERW